MRFKGTLEDFGLDSLDLLPLAARATGAPVVKVHSVNVERLKCRIINSTTKGIGRLTGKAVSSSAEEPFSVILKTLMRPEEVPEFCKPTSWNYWKAESIAYQSDALRKMDGLAVPQCYLVRRRGLDSITLCLEEVKGTQVWTRRHYLDAIENIVQFNMQKNVSGVPRRNWFKSLTKAQPLMTGIVQNTKLWKNKYVRRAFPTEIAQEFERVYSISRKWLKELDSSPHGVAHLDLQDSNMFRDSVHGKRLWVIDWGFVSMAPLGADVGQLASQIAFWSLLPSSQLDSFIREASRRYAKLLQQEGMRLSEQSILRTVRITAALRLAYMAPWFIQGLMHAEGRKGMETRMKRPWNDVAHEWGRAVSFLLRYE